MTRSLEAQLSPTKLSFIGLVYFAAFNLFPFLGSASFADAIINRRCNELIFDEHAQPSRTGLKLNILYNQHLCRPAPHLWGLSLAVLSFLVLSGDDGKWICKVFCPIFAPSMTVWYCGRHNRPIQDSTIIGPIGRMHHKCFARQVSTSALLSSSSSIDFPLRTRFCLPWCSRALAGTELLHELDELTFAW